MAQDGSFRAYTESGTAQASLVSEVYLVVEVPKTFGFSTDVPLHVTAVSILFSALDQKLVSSIAPSKVVMPLVARGFDAAEAVEQLGTCGYRGAVWVLAPKLPNRRMVERELKSLVAGIHIEVIELDEIRVLEDTPVVQFHRPH